MNELNDLPDYIIAYIFSLVKRIKDKRTLRLVCGIWHEIFNDSDDQTKIKVKLNSQESLQDIQNCSLPVTTIQIELDKLYHVLDFNSLITFKNKIPDSVKEIIFDLDAGHLSQLWGEYKENPRIGPNMTRILIGMKYIEKLTFLLDHCEPLEFIPGQIFYLEKLTELTVQVHHVKQLNIFTNLLQFELAALRTITLEFLTHKIYYSDPNIVGFILNGHTIIKEIDQEICQPYFDLYNLLMTHWQTLENVRVTYPQILEFNQQVRVKDVNEKISRDVLEHPPHLKKLAISFLGETDRDNGDQCDLAYPLLQAQTNLVELSYLTASYSMLGWCGYAQFLNGIRSNSDTLETLKIINRNPYSWPQWEIPLFEGTSALTSCSRLSSVELNYFEIPPEICHFLSKTLQKLSLIGGLNPLVHIPFIVNTLPNIENLIFIPLPPPPLEMESIEEEPSSSAMRDCLLRLFSMTKLRQVQLPQQYLNYVDKIGFKSTHSPPNCETLEIPTVQLILNKS